MKKHDPPPVGFATPISDDDEFMTAGSAMQIVTAVVTSIGCQIGAEKAFGVLEKLVTMKPQICVFIEHMRAAISGPESGPKELN